jgi:hypothetical protein
VVGTAQQAGRHQDHHRRPPELAQPRHEERDDDDLFCPAVGEGHHEQDRDAPPRVAQFGGHDGDADAKRAARDVQAEAGNADERGETEAAQ